MWIKQRNDACQTLLERWAEPFSCWAEYVDRRKPTVLVTGVQLLDRLHHPTDLLRLAWKRLLENHPHDSICGCSIDQVHTEMAVRFDEVTQVAEEITRQSLEALAEAVHTPDGRALVVFNPTAGPRTDAVEATVELLSGLEATAFRLVDSQGRETACELLSREDRIFGEMEGPGVEVQAVLADTADGWLMDMAVRRVQARRQGETAEIEVLLSEEGEPDLDAVVEGLAEARLLLADPEVTGCHLLMQMIPRLHVRLIAREVPGYGFKAWRVEAQGSQSPYSPLSADRRAWTIENEFLRVNADPADGTLTVTDRETGAIYSGLNRFVDGGDRGDLYNFCRPEEDLEISVSVWPPEIRVEAGLTRQTLEIDLLYRLPAALAPDRRSRAPERVDATIHTTISLSPGVRRVDVHTEVDNRVCDHRLRVHFPAPLVAHDAQYDGHFDVVTRSLGLPAEDTSSWIEQPVAQQPQRHFVDVCDGRVGLLIANRGLPEVEVIPEEHRTTIALTLLRCVGWLSRDDFPCRHGNAGPVLATPGAQCLGGHAFDYAIIPHAGDWRAASAEAYASTAPLRAVSTGRHEGKLPFHAGIAPGEPDEFVVTAIKQAEEGEGWIVRGYSVADEVLRVRLRPWWHFSRAARLRLDETWLHPLEVGSGGSVEFALRPKEIATVRFSGEILGNRC